MLRGFVDDHRQHIVIVLAGSAAEIGVDWPLCDLRVEDAQRDIGPSGLARGLDPARAQLVGAAEDAEVGLAFMRLGRVGDDLDADRIAASEQRDGPTHFVGFGVAGNDTESGHGMLLHLFAGADPRRCRDRDGRGRRAAPKGPQRSEGPDWPGYFGAKRARGAAFTRRGK